MRAICESHTRENFACGGYARQYSLAMSRSSTITAGIYHKRTCKKDLCAARLITVLAHFSTASRTLMISSLGLIGATAPQPRVGHKDVGGRRDGRPLRGEPPRV